MADARCFVHSCLYVYRLWYLVCAQPVLCPRELTLSRVVRRAAARTPFYERMAKDRTNYSVTVSSMFIRRHSCICY